MPRTKWIIPPDRTAEARRLADALRLSPLTALMLVNRGLSDPGTALGFLQPRLADLKDPCGDPVVTEAAHFLVDAVNGKRRIAVYGDYDADGICATAVLQRCFRLLGAEVSVYIPHRIDEGYGLNHEAIEELAYGGTEVLVTVDCGISSPEEVAFARGIGMDVVVTDHHEPDEQLPAATHVLNPKLPDQNFGYEYLAGVGVAFKLAWAIGQELSGGKRVSDEFKDFLFEALALVALGTIADVVPLADENRILALYGLKAMSNTTGPGLRALIDGSRLRGSGVTARDVAFRLAPPLNAAGRMGDASAAVELLITSDEDSARYLASHLEEQNRLRRDIQRKAIEQAERMIADDEHIGSQGCIVLVSPDWHHGVVGLVASRLAERFWRPTFIFVDEGERARGSARSVPGFSLFDAVQQCADLLERYGGHDAAAGLTLRMENLAAFTERVSAMAEEALGREPPVAELETDGDMLLRSLNLDVVQEMRRLEPFGAGNPNPVFTASDLRLVGNPQIVGSNHLAFWVRQDDTTLRAFAPGQADWLDEFRARGGEHFSLAFEPILSSYRGPLTVELRVEDMQWDDDRLVEQRLS